MTEPQHQFTLFPRRRHTKIVATLGPASSGAAEIEALLRAGADVFRLNFSHGAVDEHRARVAAIRRLEALADLPIAIVADLQGPKLRIGTFVAGAAAILEGRPFRLDSDAAPGDATRVCLPHPELFRALAPGADILLDDGRVRLRVTGQGSDHVDTVILSGRSLSDRKGVNVPGIVLPLTALTPKDRVDLSAALDLASIGSRFPSCNGRRMWRRRAGSSAAARR